MDDPKNLKIDPKIMPAIMAAFQAYQNGMPVVIRDENEQILHGEQILREIVEYGVPLKCRAIKNVNRALFEAGDAPEFLEAARLVYWEQRRSAAGR